MIIHRRCRAASIGAIMILFASLQVTRGVEPHLTQGIGRFSLSCQPYGKSQSIPIWYYVPPGLTPESRIVIVMHGMNRNAKDYLEDWVEPAERHNWLIVAPEFSVQRFPGQVYNVGCMRDSRGRTCSQRRWCFSVIERLFDQVVRDTDSTRKKYTLFGHSAGAQFIHRMVLFQRDARIELAIAANAGYYTMPDRLLPFPFGLGRIRCSDHQLAAALARPLVIMLGEEDTKANALSPLLALQGPHRLARGQRFFQFAQDVARTMGVPFVWQERLVPDAGHDHRSMALAASDLIALMERGCDDAVSDPGHMVSLIQQTAPRQ